MPKLPFEKLLHDNNSVNVSVYKPDGISSFWNWFTRKNKTGDIPKTVFDTSYRLKLNENDLNMLKGIDLQKLMATKNKKKFPNQHKIFFLPKTSLGSKEQDIFDNFALHMKQKPFQNGTKTFKQEVKSMSSFSIKSNHSLKYIHKIKSQRSIVHSVGSNRATCRVGNTTRGPRNVLLKSVPPAVLESNLQNKVFLPLYVGKRKTDKGNRTQKNKPAENCKHGYEKNESDVIPMLLTKIKSMEEQISDIENKTKQINEVVSQQQILKTSTNNNKTGTAEKSIGVETKNLVTHKVYPKKSKTCPKKLKNKRKLNYASGNSLKGTKKTKDLNVKTVNNTHDKNKTNQRKATDNFLNNPETFLGFHNFTIPNIMSKKNLFQANPDIGCDMILQLFKTLSEVSSAKIGHTEAQKHGNLNFNNESSFDGPKTISNFSKPTFDWKHKSLTSGSESQDEETNKRSSGIRKNHSFPLRNEVTKKDISQVNKILEGSQQQKNMNICKSLEQKSDSCHIALEEKIQVSGEKDISEQTSPGLGKMPKQNMDEIKKLPETVKWNQDFPEKHFDLEETKASEYSDELIFKKHLELQICENKSVQLDVKDLNISKTVVEQCSNAVLSHVESKVYIEQPMNKMSGITMEPCKLCSFHIKQSEMSTSLINPTENLSNRTTILCSNVRNDPKVSITILVEDNLKNEVKMKSNVVVDNEDIREIYTEQKVNEVKFPVLKSISGNGDSENSTSEINSKEENSKQNNSAVSLNEINDLNYLKAAVSSSSLSIQSENNVHIDKQSCYCDINFDKINTTEGNIKVQSNQGIYLNQEKRKAFEEQLFGDKIKSKESKNSIKPSLEKSSTDFKRYTKPSRILSQTFVVERNSIETHKTNKNKLPIHLKTSKYCLNSETCETMTTNFPKQINKLSDGNGRLRLGESDPVSSKEMKLEKQQKYTFFKNKHLSVGFKDPKDLSKCEILTKNQNNLNPSLRSSKHGLVQEPLFRDLESRVSIEKLNSIVHRYEKGDNIKIQTQPENTNGIPQQKHKVLGATSVETMPSGVSNNNKNNNSPSFPITKPILSTVSVQTDWSLVGITIEHFQSEVNIKAPNVVLKVSVSTQTEDLVKQTELSHKEIGSLSAMFFDMKNEKLISKNTNSEINESSKQITSKSGKPSTVEEAVTNVTTVSEPVTVTLHTAESVRTVEKENEVRVDFTTLSETPITGVEHSKGMTDDVYQNHVNQHKDKTDLLPREMEDFHNCLIPCFHPLLEETVLFKLADNATTYQDFMSNKILPKKSPLLNQTHCFGPYSKPGNTYSSKHYLSKVLSKTKLKNTKNSSFCTVLGGTYSVERSALTNGKTSLDKYPGSKNKSCDNTKDPKIKPQQLDCLINRDQDQEERLMDKKVNSGLKYNKTGTFKKITCLKDSTESKSMCSLTYKTSELLSSSPKSEKHMDNYLSGFECGDVEKNLNSVMPFTLGHYTSSGNHK